MPKLVVSRQGTLVSSRFLEEARLTLGRSSQSDLKLEDPAVSKHHAVIEMLGKDAVLRDLGSVNGIKVNGQDVARHLLRHGDLIEIAPFQIRFVDHKSVTGGDGDRTVLIQSADSDPAPLPRPAATTDTARAVDVRYPRGALRWRSGPQAGGAVPLDRVLVGLGEPGPQVIAIFRRPEGFAVASLEGAPPLVNGAPAARGWHPLASGDRIRLGPDELELETDPA